MNRFWSFCRSARRYRAHFALFGSGVMFVCAFGRFARDGLCFELFMDLVVSVYFASEGVRLLPRLES